MGSGNAPAAGSDKAKAAPAVCPVCGCRPLKASLNEPRNASAAEAMKTRKADDKSNIVFVGGLRKSTTEDIHLMLQGPVLREHRSMWHAEDKVAGHFSKFGQVDSVRALSVQADRFSDGLKGEACFAPEVDIKRLPDGTSRGFAFVKFVEVAILGECLVHEC